MDLDHGHCWGSWPGYDVDSSLFHKRKGRRSRYLGHGHPWPLPAVPWGCGRAQPSLGLRGRLPSPVCFGQCWECDWPPLLHSQPSGSWPFSPSLTASSGTSPCLWRVPTSPHPALPLGRVSLGASGATLPSFLGFQFTLGWAGGLQSLLQETLGAGPSKTPSCDAGPQARVIA